MKMQPVVNREIYKFVGWDCRNERSGFFGLKKKARKIITLSRFENAKKPDLIVEINADGSGKIIGGEVLPYDVEPIHVPESEVTEWVSAYTEYTAKANQFAREVFDEMSALKEECARRALTEPGFADQRHEWMIKRIDELGLKRWPGTWRNTMLIQDLPHELRNQCAQALDIVAGNQ